jgi:hypothetical protein
MTRLAPVEGGELWLADRALNPEAKGASHFGTIAVLEPLDFAVVETSVPGIWVGVNRESRGGLVWVPPSRVQAPIPWDSIATVEAALEHIGPGVARERELVIERLGVYLEEIEALTRAGVPVAATKWCDVDPEARAKELATRGIAPRWSPSR